MTITASFEMKKMEKRAIEKKFVGVVTIITYI